jgi:hypothetical protein
MKIELLWFEDCPCHGAAEDLVNEVLSDLGIESRIVRVEVTNSATADDVQFPGSPTVRVDGVDVEPGWEPCPECTPRCRLYQNKSGLGCLPEKAWIEKALRVATAHAGEPTAYRGDEL